MVAGAASGVGGAGLTLNTGLFFTTKGAENAEERILVSHNKKEIKELMSDYIGIVRNTIRLERAFRRMKMMMAGLFSLRNMPNYQDVIPYWAEK